MTRISCFLFLKTKSTVQLELSPVHQILNLPVINLDGKWFQKAGSFLKISLKISCFEYEFLHGVAVIFLLDPPLVIPHQSLYFQNVCLAFHFLYLLHIPILSTETRHLQTEQTLTLVIP